MTAASEGSQHSKVFFAVRAFVASVVLVSLAGCGTPQTPPTAGAAVLVRAAGSPTSDAAASARSDAEPGPESIAAPDAGSIAAPDAGSAVAQAAPPARAESLEFEDSAAVDAWLTAHGASGTINSHQCAALRAMAGTSAARRCRPQGRGAQPDPGVSCRRFSAQVAGAEALQCASWVYPSWGHDDALVALVVYVVRGAAVRPVWSGFTSFGNTHNPDDSPPVQWASIQGDRLVVEVFQHPELCAQGFLAEYFRRRLDPTEETPPPGELYIYPGYRRAVTSDFAALCRAHGRFEVPAGP